MDTTLHCPVCGSTMGCDSDADLGDFEIEGTGIARAFFCTYCGASAEVFETPVEERNEYPFYRETQEQ